LKKYITGVLRIVFFVFVMLALIGASDTIDLGDRSYLAVDGFTAMLIIIAIVVAIITEGTKLYKKSLEKEQTVVMFDPQVNYNGPPIQGQSWSGFTIDDIPPEKHPYGKLRDLKQ